MEMDADLLPSPSPSPSPDFHCDYSDWPPSLSIIPSIYLMAFLVGCLGNGLVLWAYLDRGEGRRRRGRKVAGGKTCCGKLLGTSERSCGFSTKQHRPSPPSPSSSSSSPPRPSRSLTDSLIASLALADLCFLVTLPLWAAYTALGYHWPFGTPLCRLSSFLTALNMYSSVFSLSALSVERYWVLTGRRNRPRGRPAGAPRVLGGVWVLAGFLALPGLLLRSVQEVELDPDGEGRPGPVVLSCQMDYSVLVGAGQEEDEEEEPGGRERAEMRWAAALSLKSTLVGFLIPLVVLLVCYCSLARLLSRHFGRGPRPDRGRQRRLLRVIVTLVMAFFLCWLPLHVNKTLSLLLEFGLVPFSCSLDQVSLAAQPYVTCLAYLNSCLNPLLYAACDPSFRKRCKGALLVVLCRRGGARKEVEGGGGGGGGEEKEKEEEEEERRTQEETGRTEEEVVGGVGQ